MTKHLNIAIGGVQREVPKIVAEEVLSSLLPLRRTIYEKQALSAPWGITGALFLELLPRLHSRLV